MAALALGACGGSDDDAASNEAQPAGPVRAGSVAQLAQCRDWNEASVEERSATVEDVRSQINLADATVETPSLSDEQAYELFEDACSNDFAKGFRLYKIYARAIAYESFLEGE